MSFKHKKGQPKQQNEAWEGSRLQFHDLTNLRPGRRQNKQKGKGFLSTSNAGTPVRYMDLIELKSSRNQKKEQNRREKKGVR
jgi:hypothetical protein